MASREPKVQYMMVEMKARMDSLDDVRTQLFETGARRVGVFHQVDTYYRVPKGRLKLREIEEETAAQLVYYERENVAEPKRSTVFLVTIPRPQKFKRLVEQVVRIRGVVDKIREIYSYEGTQIHLDTVGDLGFFVEFERGTSTDPKDQKEDLQRLEQLRVKLSIDRRNLEKRSYVDMI
jgi:predicted adenylyl cyclase CyaB